MKLIRFFGSLRFALGLIASLVLILTLSTVLESLYGTPFVQKNFYAAHWFDFFLGLMFINILCAALTRWPFKKRHIGFVITHIGILTLLIGCLLSRLLGSEGQMTLQEGAQSDKILKNERILKIVGPDKKEQLLSLKSKPSHLPYQLPGTTDLILTAVLEHAVETRYLTETTSKEINNPAIQIHLNSTAMGFDEKFTLIAHDPDNPEAHSRAMGPATFILEKKSLTQVKASSVLLIRLPSEEIIPIHLSKSKTTLPLGSSGLTISNIRYFENAKVKDNQLVDTSSEGGTNPAVTFEVSDEMGHKEHHTKFMIFPEFSSIRGGTSSDTFHLGVLLVPDETAHTETQGASFRVFPPSESQDAWNFEVHSSKGLTQQGALHAGDSIVTGWADIEVKIVSLYQRAKISYVIRKETAENTPGVLAMQLAAQQGKSGEKFAWVTENRPAMIDTLSGSYKIAITPEAEKLPFSLQLRDFRKIDYPGTASPAAFESDVTLSDSTASLKIEKKIYMNHPLDYAGWRIFQASYIQDPEQGEASVFSIAKNPGIYLIYGGGIIILIGVILLFYFHPFFNRSLPGPST